ncbi:5-formyltetrahydrofolate cyclo-ligase [Neoasaia chiangmaiensis NBRC 101099]|uniref:5-formyltetrahydrofolate cyclo-ligase n=1 Tax=Neoasaia chiangmaiensis TaxID=320497 RepID=A0A1U9KS35_9PROT|nr:5-formyltetrahydrofolate cyclo-ligase [Neoasaia chiangmaiensis]AQS88636.1 hypothetical protein A0U93_12650 [Neoasaia chiangmaiensis]GBR35987.1 5-formyltetrahydrofolate cyclo-ligase [Neoasaia chiangmaiensis NBRC 101099]GEN15506.1 5-formyltetrahydrofolate cyclo-ligase [Neoasaia chiangmaiensis]
MVVPHDIDQRKRLLRKQMREARLQRDVGAEAAEGLRANLLRAIHAYPHGRVGCVWPLPGEADLRPLCHELVRQGRDVLLPETTVRGEALLFRLWHPHSAMLSGRFGTFHPDGAVGHPDIILVPLLAFDRRLHRLGYGGGYYDRTLAALKCHGIGFAFSWQEVAHVPVGAYDWPLDKVVTEHEVLALPTMEKDAR